MNKCGDCKYFGEEIVIEDWDSEGDYAEINTGYHACERIKHCEHFYRKEEREGIALVVDGSGYFAALRVTSDFGCVAFEQKT